MITPAKTTGLEIVFDTHPIYVHVLIEYYFNQGQFLFNILDISLHILRLSNMYQH